MPESRIDLDADMCSASSPLCWPSLHPAPKTQKQNNVLPSLAKSVRLVSDFVNRGKENGIFRELVSGEFIQKNYGKKNAASLRKLLGHKRMMLSGR